jgi:hypothetical protein
MERIVQLTDYEYKRLKEQAEATQATIEEGIREGIKDACRKIRDHVEKWLDQQIRKRYKVDVDTINKYRDRLSNQWKWNLVFFILSSSGWIAAVLTWIL